MPTHAVPIMTRHPGDGSRNDDAVDEARAIQRCQPGNVVIRIYPCLGTWAGHHRINMPPLLTTVSPVINWAPSPSTSQSTRAAISEGDAVLPSGI